ncbi:MAG: LytTR family DNA-binding domain-containing protein [Pseudomonadota bacterium]
MTQHALSSSTIELKSWSITCVAFNGVTVEVQPRLFGEWLKSGYFWLFFALSVLLLSSYAPVEGTSSVQLPDSTSAFWAIIALKYLFVSFVYLCLLGSLLQYFGVAFLPLPILSVFVVVTLLITGPITYSNFVGMPIDYSCSFFWYAAYFFVVEQIFQVLYLTLVLPLVSGNQSLARKGVPGLPKQILEEPTDPSKYVWISRKKYVRSRLQYLSSVEHYVRVVEENEDHLVRANLSDIVEQLTEEDGLRTHRSHYVFGTAISGAKYSEQKLYVVMNDGAEFTVARSRRSQVLKWLEAHGLEVAR